MKIYDTLTQSKKEFKPLNAPKVNFYYCGITVYDRCHIGHARTWVAFDVMHRYLKHKGYEVNLVRNITDIDDKIIKKSIDSGRTVKEITDENIKLMHDDLAALNILPATHEPRATECLTQMIEMIESLIKSGNAYQGTSCDVYFRTGSYPAYGELSHKNLEDLRFGERVESATDKESPLDFVLWKMAKPGEPEYESPWGAGRPGWHIECSAMAANYCGKTLDIHGGGADLTFPHHENERAQSECTHEISFVQHWCHVGFVQMNAEKMSKSLGNIALIHDVLEKYHPEAVRYFLLSRHYRSPVDFTDKGLAEAQSALTRLYTALRDVPPVINIPSDASAQFNIEMDDDFNTPRAMAVLFDLAHEVQKTKSGALSAELKELAGVLGLLQASPEVFLQTGVELDAAKIEQMIQERNDAKAAKDYALADKIRAELDDAGIVLEDSPTGTTWRSKN